MNYSIANLNEIADCVELLSWAAREKEDLEYRKTTNLRQTVRFRENFQGVDAELVGILAELSAVEITIAALPDGEPKRDAIKKRTRLEYKKFLLETRKESYGTVALIEKEMDLGRVLREIEEVGVFMEAVEVRKAALEELEPA